MQVGGRVDLGQKQSFALLGGGDCEVEPAVEGLWVGRLADGAFENDGADAVNAKLGEFFDEPVETKAFGDADCDYDAAGFGRSGSADGFESERDDIFSYGRYNGCGKSTGAVEKLDLVAGAESQDCEVMGLGAFEFNLEAG